MKIINTKIFALQDSIIRSGYPMRLGKPLLFKEASEKDLKRAKKLGGVPSCTGHDNFLKGIIVQFDLQYPEYISPQLQRYNWVNIVSSQSKMHKIMSKKLTQEDFTSEIYPQHLKFLNENIKKRNFNIVLNNLPMGYLKWMGVSTNYLQLKTIYFQRKNHKLQEWKYFCNWIENLPMFKELILNK